MFGGQAEPHPPRALQQLPASSFQAANPERSLVHTLSAVSRPAALCAECLQQKLWSGLPHFSARRGSQNLLCGGVTTPKACVSVCVLRAPARSLAAQFVQRRSLRIHLSMALRLASVAKRALAAPLAGECSARRDVLSHRWFVVLAQRDPFGCLDVRGCRTRGLPPFDLEEVLRGELAGTDRDATPLGWWENDQHRLYMACQSNLACAVVCSARGVGESLSLAHLSKRDKQKVGDGSVRRCIARHGHGRLTGAITGVGGRSPRLHSSWTRPQCAKSSRLQPLPHTGCGRTLGGPDHRRYSLS